MADTPDLNRQLDSLISEARNPATFDLDQLDTLSLLQRLNDEDCKVADAVARELPVIAQVVDAVVAALKAGGRLVYLGAGTSGRLGVLDAAECPPTFSVPPDWVLGIMAGGEGAMFRAVEGAEDNPELGAADLKDRAVSSRDVVIGIAASGRTPYVLGALAEARAAGARTVALTCNPGSPVALAADFSIATVVGPEALTGSTRLKSGSAHKMVLNLISTAAMVGMGKVYENLMVDVNPSNAKLKVRAARMVATATGCDLERASTQLARCGFSAKLAILAELADLTPDAARALLDQHHGFLRAALMASGVRTK